MPNRIKTFKHNLRRLKLPVFTALSILLLSPAYPMGSNSTETVTIMTYNAENLFDTEHDEGKFDYTNMPLEFKKKNPRFMQKNCPDHKFYRKLCLNTDWSQKRLNEKLERFSEAILENTDDKGPDLLLLQEVENLNVLNMLKKRLNAENEGDDYRHAILIEGPDERGIDTAVLSKLDPAETEPQLHRLKLPDGDETRGILQADFRLSTGQILTVFNFHFPSQSNPVQFREIGFKKLNSLAEKIYEKDPDRLMIAGGDSNVTADEHHIFTDLTEKFFSDSLEYHHRKEHGVGGTHYYRGEWSMLDVFLIGRNLLENSTDMPSYRLDKGSFRVATEYDKQTYRNRHGHVIPSRYAHPKYYGVSDHYPVIFKLKLSP